MPHSRPRSVIPTERRRGWERGGCAGGPVATCGLGNSVLAPAGSQAHALPGLGESSGHFLPAAALGKTDQGRAGVAAARPLDAPRFCSRQLACIVTPPGAEVRAFPPSSACEAKQTLVSRCPSKDRSSRGVSRARPRRNSFDGGDRTYPAGVTG